MVVFDITIPCLEFIQRCLEHFYRTFFWHWFFFSPFNVEQEKNNDKVSLLNSIASNQEYFKGIMKLCLGFVNAILKTTYVYYFWSLTQGHNINFIEITSNYLE